jgi:putative nucleotidyltransferase with HDIG domain
MESCAPEILTISAERVFEELTKLLLSPKPDRGLEVLLHTGLLGLQFPELQSMAWFRKDQGKYHHLPVWEHTLEVVKAAEKTPIVKWAALFHDIAKPATWSQKGSDVHFYQHDRLGSEIWEQIAVRLKTSTDFKTRVSKLIYEHQNVRGDMSDKAIRRLMHRVGDDLQNLFWLREADIIGHNPAHRESSLNDLNQLVRRVQTIQDRGPISAHLPTGTGTMIADALGIKPGKELGDIMKQLQQMMVDGDLTPDSNLVAVAQTIHRGV